LRRRTASVPWCRESVCDDDDTTSFITSSLGSHQSSTWRSPHAEEAIIHALFVANGHPSVFEAARYYNIRQYPASAVLSCESLTEA
jgi:hypothetical protein